MPRQCWLRVGGHSSNVALRSCTERERSTAGAVPFRSPYADRSKRSTVRARGKLACFATSQETASAVALVRVPRECRLPDRGHSSHVAPRSCAEEKRPSAGTVPSDGAQIDHNQRSTAPRSARLRVLPPPERQPAQWRLFACHVNAGCVLEATARTSHYGLEPKERGLPPVQCPVLPRMPTVASAARRVRAASSRVLSIPEGQPAQWRARTSVTRMSAARRRPQLARRTMVLHRRRDASCRCSVLL